MGDRDTSVDGPITLSLPEVSALCLRAARGAGLSWGMAEECGSAAAWLAEYGFDWSDVMLACLDAPPGPPIRPAPGQWLTDGPACGLQIGVTLAEFAALPEGPGSATTLGVVMSPVVLLPFIVRSARTLGKPLEVLLDGTVWARSSDKGVVMIRPDLNGLAAAMVRLRPVSGSGAGVSLECHQTAPLSPRNLALLEALALSMTVPPSEQSMKGAGPS